MLRQALKFNNITIIFVLLIPLSLLGSSFTPVYKPSITIPRINSSPSIDGKLNDSFWKEAKIADNFVETSPGNQIEPMVQTRVMIGYDDANLYLAFVCNDDPSTIRASYSDRDQIFSDDYCGLLMDTYADQSWGYEFFVNPYGIQGDLRIVEGNGEDMSFDLIWESKGMVTDSGYQVELAIPFSSLRFPNAEKQSWRINFWRDRQRDVRRRFSWSAQDWDDPCWMCQLGYLEGIEGIKPGRNIEITPSAIGKQFGYRNSDNDPNAEFIDEDADAELSLNAKYGLTTNSSIEVALNPDFSQVESDAAQISVNNNFGLFYPETRPFFQEGSQHFNTPINIIYTRTLNNPDFTTKFTGQFGNFSIAYLFGSDETSPVIIPLKKQSIYTLVDRSIANVLRAKYSLPNNSHIGLSVTDRRWDDFKITEELNDGSYAVHSFEDGYGNLISFDTRVRFAKYYNFNAQVMFTNHKEINDIDNILIDTTFATGRAQSHFGDGRYTVALDGEKYNGRALVLQLSRNTQHWNQMFFLREFSPSFRADNGFQTMNDRRFIYYETSWGFVPNKKWLIDWGPGLSLGRIYDYYGKFDLFKFNNAAYDEWANVYFNFTFKGQTNLRLEYINSREKYSGVLFEGISRFTFDLSSRFNKRIHMGVFTMFGKTIRRFRQAPEMGNALDYGAWADIKTTDRMVVSFNYNFSRLHHRQDYLDKYPTAKQEIFSGYIFRSRINYQFTRELFLRLVLQYDNFNEIFSVEPLLTYKINPFTKFFIGMTHNYKNYYPQTGVNDLQDETWDMSNRQFFAKLQYLFQM